MLTPNPRLPKVEYIIPKSVEDAHHILMASPDRSIPFLGGTDCFIAIRDKKIQPEYLVDLKHLNNFGLLDYDDHKGLSVGAAVTLNKIVQSKNVQTSFPMLVQAASQIGGYQLRNRATLVGNLCNASPCGDMIAPSMVYRGVANVVGVDGNKLVSLESFFTGPGETILRPGDIVQSIIFPQPPPKAEGVYLSIGRNRLSDLAIAAVTVLAYPDNTSTTGYRYLIALSAVAPTVIFINEAQELLANQPAKRSTFEEAAIIARKYCRPIDDVRSSKSYRLEMVQSLTFQALCLVWNKLHEK